MAALTDSYQPEGISFSQHYPETSRDFDDQELDEGDIVKSKPSGKMNSYLPLVEDTQYTDQPRERLGSGGSCGVRTHPERQSGQSTGSKTFCPPNTSQGAGRRGYVPTEVSNITQGAGGGGGMPPNGGIPVAEVIVPRESTRVSRSLSEQETGWSHEQATSRLQTKAEEEGDTSPSDEDSKGLEDSTTALLRRYTLERNGRPTSIHLGPSGEIVTSGWLSEILLSGHKKCSVTLEEDSITWRFLSRKDGEL